MKVSDWKEDKDSEEPAFENKKCPGYTVYLNKPSNQWILTQPDGQAIGYLAGRKSRKEAVKWATKLMNLSIGGRF